MSKKDLTVTYRMTTIADCCKEIDNRMAKMWNAPRRYRRQLNREIKVWLGVWELLALPSSNKERQ